MRERIFYDDSWGNKAITHESLLLYESAYRCYEEACQYDSDDKRAIAGLTRVGSNAFEEKFRW